MRNDMKTHWHSDVIVMAYIQTFGLMYGIM